MWNLSIEQFTGTFQEAVRAAAQRAKQNGMCMTVVEVECTKPASTVWTKGQRVVLQPFFDGPSQVPHGDPNALRLWSGESVFRLVRWWDSYNGMRFES